MAANYVTVAQLRSTLGIGTLYSDSDLESCCQTAQDILNQYLWFDSIPVVGATINSNVATLVLSSSGSYVKGQTVTITNSGSIYNGTQTITSTWPYTQGSATFPYFVAFPYNILTFPRGYSLIQFALTHADDSYHLVVPYGTCAGVDTKQTSYATTPAINQAALMLAIDVWQARQAPASGGVSVDGYTPSPYRLGNTMLAKVRGLIAGYMNPRAMVG